jgi:acetyl-CoA synthetase
VHCHGGLLAVVPREHAYFFDLGPDERFFWLTDIGWMMGAWEIIGVLFQGATLVIYEGAPNWPDPGRLWRLVERQRITHLGVSPTAVRVLMRAGDAPVQGSDLTSLRILGSTGEPWDPESYRWFFERAGGARCPVINISGGTELMGCLLVSLPIAELRPCAFSGPGLGMDVDVVDAEGRPVRGEVGYLVCRKPSPSMTRGFLNDPQRYLETYFARWPGIWYHGDWASVDSDGFWFIHGRADDTIKVAGKRIGPAEIEGALARHPAVAEAAAFGAPDPIKGEAIVCVVVLGPDVLPAPELEGEIAGEVTRRLGKALRPARIVFAPMLPKTRSGKIVRAAIRRHYLGEPVGDLSSIENPEALDALPVRTSGS